LRPRNTLHPRQSQSPKRRRSRAANAAHFSPTPTQRPTVYRGSLCVLWAATVPLRRVESRSRDWLKGEPGLRRSGGFRHPHG
jgi:hypothetical protein